MAEKRESITLKYELDTSEAIISLKSLRREVSKTLKSVAEANNERTNSHKVDDYHIYVLTGNQNQSFYIRDILSKVVNRKTIYAMEYSNIDTNYAKRMIVILGDDFKETEKYKSGVFMELVLKGATVLHFDSYESIVEKLIKK